MSFYLSGEASVDAVMECGGLGQFNAFPVADHVAAGDLEIVLSEFEPVPAPISIVLPTGQRVPSKVGAFIDLAVPAMKERLEDVSRTCGGQS